MKAIPYIKATFSNQDNKKEFSIIIKEESYLVTINDLRNNKINTTMLLSDLENHLSKIGFSLRHIEVIGEELK